VIFEIGSEQIKIEVTGRAQVTIYFKTGSFTRSGGPLCSAYDAANP
jgi:hypothetical protein